MSFLNTNPLSVYCEHRELSQPSASKNKHQKSNYPEAISSQASSDHPHITQITKSIMTLCIVRPFLDFSSIASFSKTSIFGRNIIRDTMSHWRSDGLTLTTWQIRCLWRYAKMQTNQFHLQEERLTNSIKDVVHLNLKYKYVNVNVELTYIAFYISRCSNLQILNLENHRDIPDSLPTNIRTCSNLRSLNLNFTDGYEFLTEDRIAAIIHSCKMLHTLKLAKCPITDHTLNLLSTSSHPLTHLNISNNPRFSFKALRNLLESKTYLTSLDLNRNKNLGAAEDEISGIDNLKQDVNERKKTIFESLTQVLPNMSSLNIESISLTHDACNSIPRIFPNLTKLSISATHYNPEYIYNIYFKSDSICNMIRQLPLLTHIPYHVTKENEEQILKTLIQYCPKLQTIKLFQSSTTEKYLSALTKSCPNLTKINFFWSTSLANKGFADLAILPNTLKHLDISQISPHRINPLSILTFVQQCPTLVSIRINEIYKNNKQNEIKEIFEILKAKLNLTIKYKKC